jgi:hypothetical protein
MDRRILKVAAELQAAGLAEALIGKGKQSQPSPRAQKQAPVGPKPGLASSSVACSASAQGCSGALSLGSVSAQVKAAPLRMKAVTGTGEKNSYVRLYRYCQPIFLAVTCYCALLPVIARFCLLLHASACYCSLLPAYSVLLIVYLNVLDFSFKIKTTTFYFIKVELVRQL